MQKDGLENKKCKTKDIKKGGNNSTLIFWMSIMHHQCHMMHKHCLNKLFRPYTKLHRLFKKLATMPKIAKHQD